MNFDLDRLEKLAENATPGPYRVEMVGDIGDKSAVIEGLASERKGRNNVSFGEDRETADYVAALDPETVKALIGEVRAARTSATGAGSVNPDDAVEIIATLLIGLDHIDDYNRGFGAELAELDDWEANAARAEARRIIEITLDHLNVPTVSKDS